MIVITTSASWIVCFNFDEDYLNLITQWTIPRSFIKGMNQQPYTTDTALYPLYKSSYRLTVNIKATESQVGVLIMICYTQLSMVVFKQYS